MINPFRQSPAYWQLRFRVPFAAVMPLEAVFEEIALSVASFEADESASLTGAKDWKAEDVILPDTTIDWQVEILFEAEPEQGEITRRIAIAAEMAGGEIDWPFIQKIEPKDWVSEVQQHFPPLSIGRFYVYGSHVQTPPPAGSLGLKVNAGAAFGSGEHATTSGCLLAVHNLAKQRRFTRILDMGCGSGILALAAAKTFHAPVLAVDIDAVAVNVARANARINQVRREMKAYAGNGYKLGRVRADGPYDLIFANILARPLMRFARALAANLAPGGVAILSGLLDRQEQRVLFAHRLHGLHLKARIAKDGWHTLIVGR